MLTTKRFFGRCGSAAVLALAVAFAGMSPAVAGEITGSGKSLKNEDNTLNGNSLCAYSGLNDSPNGLIIEVAPGVFVEVDPGGKIQSYGYFYAQQDFLPDPSDPASRDAFGFPANGCNPSSGDGGH